jgi:hypothetical protein
MGDIRFTTSLVTSNMDGATECRCTLFPTLMSLDNACFPSLTGFSAFQLRLTNSCVEETQGKHMLTEELEGHSTEPPDPSPGGGLLRAYMTQAHNTLRRFDHIGYIPRRS